MQTKHKNMIPKFAPSSYALLSRPLLLAATLIAIAPSVHAALYVATAGGSSVIGKYDSTTGAAINATFITPGFGGPASLALSGNDLYVASNNTPNVTVRTYDATSGSLNNASFITVPTQPTGSFALDGSYMFVSYSGGNVGKFDITTGAAINSAFITGVSGGVEMALSGNNLYLRTNSTVLQYDATTGGLINGSFITGLIGIDKTIEISGNRLFLAFSATVREYDATTGALINGSFITGLSGAKAFAIDGNDFFVANNTTIGKYDATTGSAINASFITGFANNATGLAVTTIPEPSSSVLLLGLGAMLLGRRRRAATQASPSEF
jgi:hypothetical protein